MTVKNVILLYRMKSRTVDNSLYFKILTNGFNVPEFDVI